MSSWSNYDDVLQQLRGAGLLVDRLEVASTRPVRCKVEGEGREKRGWYQLHELSVDSGDVLIVGSYGVWRGNDNGARKVDLSKGLKLSREQSDALRKRLAEDRKKLQAERDAEAERAAKRAAKAWSQLERTGDAPYLDSKGVAGHGLRYTSSGSAVVPLADGAGKIHGLQFLRTARQVEGKRRPAKEFWPAGLVKKGHFHLIGSPQHLVLVAEGYATAASLHEATTFPVAVAFDAGNLAPVAAALRKRYRHARILICADDDIFGNCQHRDAAGARCNARVVLPLHPAECPECGNPHRCVNTGITAASAAALEVSGAWLAPHFTDAGARHAEFLQRGRKLGDFNDLHQAEGLHTLRAQVEARLSELQWLPRPPRAASPSPEGGGAGDKLRPVEDVEELLERFSLIYAHGSAAFDRREHQIVSLSDMRDLCTRKEAHRAWTESPRRDVVRIREVGFDPTGRDPDVTCNLYGGWPTQPSNAGSCDRLLDLLLYLCAGEGGSDTDSALELYEWVLRWLAYPIQHPGAKMATTLVLHGPQGTGKNLFFEAVMKIYGEYADVIDQSAVEDKFNDWASRKLFMIADEVVARSDLYHVKNKLKALITGERIRINPKNFAAYWERNHLNLVFLSNESMPVVIEEDDRRHCVIWTPPPLEPGFYAKVAAEIENGGVAALHHYLLHYPLGDFRPNTKPPLTSAKRELITLGLDSPLRFHDELVAGEIVDLEAMPALSTEWYDAYKHWCQRTGVRAAPQKNFTLQLAKKRGVENAKKHYRTPSGKRAGPHWFLLLGQAEPPEGKTLMDHLGYHADRAKEMIAAYRGVGQS